MAGIINKTNEVTTQTFVVTQPDTANIENSISSEGRQPDSGEAVIINRLSIIIPAYNEEKTIAKILNRINEVKLIRNIEKEVIIVNDCSSDNTEVVIQNFIANAADLTINYFKYIKHDINQGK